MTAMDIDNMARPLEEVVREEKLATYSLPLKIRDRQELFEQWCRLNPRTLRDIELTALAISQRGLRVSTKYLIEKQRYEGDHKIVGVPFVDGYGNTHVYAINNTDTPLLSRWLLELHPELNIELRKSIYDAKEVSDASQDNRQAAQGDRLGCRGAEGSPS